VRDLVLRLLDGGSCNVETVAQHLGVDRRTMHRRLQAERTTFSAIYGDIQMELANRYLGEAGQPLSEIAIRLGFATPSGFSRWYRQHFGHAPSVGHPRSLRRLAPSRL
jgi:AraC-like DNA-binding protein